MSDFVVGDGCASGQLGGVEACVSCCRCVSVGRNMEAEIRDESPFW